MCPTLCSVFSFRTGQTGLTGDRVEAEKAFPGAYNPLISLTLQCLHLGLIIPLTLQISPSAG